MLDMERPVGLEALFLCARKTPTNHALLAFGLYVTGRRAYVATGSLVLRGTEHGAEMVRVGRPREDVPIVEDLDDPAIGPLGLRLSVVQQSTAAAMCPPQAAAVALRLGLLAQCLDRAFAHLDGRESFNQKVLHHQLVKADFSRSNAIIQRLLAELSVAGDEMGDAVALAMHNAISREFTQAAKLMGGHGFLTGGTHELEYVSNLVLAIHGPARGRNPIVASAAVGAGNMCGEPIDHEIEVLSEGIVHQSFKRIPIPQHSLRSLEGWRRMRGILAADGVHQAVFDGASGPSLFGEEVKWLWDAARKVSPGHDPCLVYFHCGYHLDPRTPLLQHLLNFLSHRGAVHAFRVESATALADAMSFAMAMTARIPVFVLHDQTERLSPREPEGKTIRCMFLARKGISGVPATASFNLLTS